MGDGAVRGGDLDVDGHAGLHRAAAVDEVGHDPLHRVIVMGGVIGSSELKCVIPHIEPNHRLGLSLVTKTQVRFAGSFTWGKSEFVLVLKYMK